MPFFLLSQRGEQNDVTRAVCGCTSAMFSVGDVCAVCALTHALGVCTHWEYVLRLATGWTWGHRAHLSLISLLGALALCTVVALLLIQPCSESA